MKSLPQNERGLFSFATAMLVSLVSLTGTQMTIFAVVAWAWQVSHSTSATGLVTVISFATIVASSVFTGALVDRWDRKLTIIYTDVMGALASLGILLLYLTGNLQIWHLAVLGIILGLLESFQFPAYLTSITAMVAEEQRSRANAMFQLSWSISSIVSSVLAGVLFAIIGLTGILLIDVLTFAAIIITVMLLPIPRGPKHAEGEQGSIWKSIAEGLRYLMQRPGLYWTIFIFGSINVAYGAYLGLFRPMVLALTTNNTVILGQALGAMAAGSVIGGFVMTIWKGPKNKTLIMLVAWSLMSAFGFVLDGLGRSLLAWLVAGFFQGLFNDIALALTFAIWQSHIDENMQGRIFGVIRLVAQGPIPLATLFATLLTDHLVEPAMQPGKPLAALVSNLIGSGTGASVSFVLVTIGLLFGVVAPLLGFLLPVVRNADQANKRTLPESP